MEDEYETLCASSVENCKTIAEWYFNNPMSLWVVDHEGKSGEKWCRAVTITPSRKYRRKKPKTDVLLTDPEEISRGIKLGVVQYKRPIFIWFMDVDENIFEESSISFIKRALSEGDIYRLKSGCKLPPKKTKKLVPRTAEEFWPLIGKWWTRNKANNNRYLIVNDIRGNDFETQENWEIAPLGTEEWQPMCKEIEVEECAG